jgi:hypothetical protein
MKSSTVLFLLLFFTANPLLSEIIIHSDNKLFEMKESSLKELEIEPEVKFYSIDRNTICYLQNKNGNLKKIILGLFDISEKKILMEKKLSFEWNDYEVIKFFYVNGSAYIFLKNSAGEKSAVKINLNDLKTGKYNEIEDFSIISGTPALIEKKNNSYIFKFSNSEIPLIYNNPPHFINSIDDRIIIISDGKIYDFIDIAQKKILFSSKINGNSQVNEKYNFEISITDESIPENENNSSRFNFYKIYINGTETGRTESGYTGIEKIFNDNLSINAYHTVKIELWELNSGKNKYERANNIRQPSPLKIFISNGRKIRLNVKFDGITYKNSLE